VNATAIARAKAKTLAELRKFDGPLYVQNNTPFKVNAHDDIGDKRFVLELAPAGDPDSIAVLPKIGLESRSIQRMWIAGKLSVSQDDRMEDQIALMMGGVLTDDQRIASINVPDFDGKTITPEVTGGNTHKGFVEKPCLVCGAYNRQTGLLESGRVTQTIADEKNGVPPLCGQHAGLISSYVPRQVSDKGVEHWEFDRMEIGKPTISIK
jgi:hypothetical protein